MTKAKVLKNALQRKGMIVAPGAFDSLSAKIIEKIGFEAIYVTGFGVSSSLLGKPDLGIVSLGEMISHLEKINSIVSLPIIADGESGFGTVINTMRTVELYENAGIAGLHIEDQYVPKRYKSDGLPQVMSMEEHCDKIKAAVTARKDEAFCIIARTDVLQRCGIREAIKRGNAYRESGADMIFIHGAKEWKDLELIVREIDAPNLVNYSTLREAGISPLPSMTELEDLGFKVAIAAGEPLFCAANAMEKMLTYLKEFKSLQAKTNEFMGLNKFFEYLELEKYAEFENAYLPEEKYVEKEKE